MTEQRIGLTKRERELVGVGASVGAGCHPCVTHHVKAGTEVGIEPVGLLAAIVAAERVTADASARMAQHARRGLPATQGPLPMAVGGVTEATLAALGAAVAANSMPNIERYLREVAELGVSHDELVDAVRVAHEVQANAARIHAARTSRLLDAPPLGVTEPSKAQDWADTCGDEPPVAGRSSADDSAETCDDGCPCHDDDARPDPATGTAVPSAASRSSVGAETAATALSGRASSPDQTHSEATGGQGAPAVAGRESSQSDERGGMESMMAACMPPRAMVAGCCDTTTSA